MTGPALESLEVFGPLTQRWFSDSFASPTTAQAAAWQAIAAREDALVVAPTGSGKTLAAFLFAIDQLAQHGGGGGTRVLYISPLKALGVDVERNLRSPLQGLQQLALRTGVQPPAISVGVRTGDTDAQQRRALVSRPPDILITTPESLFLMLTSKAREKLASIETVIVDEIHAIAATKRGVHLAMSLERLEHLAQQRPQRIGLSATVRPATAVASFLSGSHPCRVVETPVDKQLEVRVDVPVPDLADLGTAAGPTDEEGATPSIWPHIESRLVDLIAEHRSTLVFTNSRRSAEKLTARLNEEWARRSEEPVDLPDEVASQLPGMAGQSEGAPALVRAHHGSVSKEQRAEIEDLLKTGRLPAVVATSSLELGIDMGAVDLVAQVEAPPSVAAGLQRIGRAGHQVGAVSRGVVLPKHRGDLLTSAVVADQMQRRNIETMNVPRNALDVLAQHIVSMVAMDDWTVADLLALVHRCDPFATLPEDALRAVLDMLAGRYPADEFATLRPRLNWDRAEDVLSGRAGAQRVAVTSGGTIPDRGLYGVYLAAASERGGQRVGELDEEMVYESRVGDVFSLGASSWRIEDITPDRVLVSPAPGRPGKLPFWHGDAIGRPYALGREIGAFTRQMTGGRVAGEHLRSLGLSDWAVENLQRYVGEQQQACGTVPDDRTIVVERFRDEIGDWRIVWHSPFGARVHAPWALLIGAAAAAEFGIDASVMATDDGIIARLPDTGDEEFLSALTAAAFPEPDVVRDAVAAQVAGSALFAARFRECAARALLLPKRDPKRRAPLWQQRQRAAQLLSVASQYPTFPITLEAMRECLQDVYDLPALASILADVGAGKIRVVEVETPRPSPFAQSLLFSYIANYLYDGDSPLAERRAQALALDPELLSSLLGDAQLRELLDPAAIEQVEAELQYLTERTAVNSLDRAADAFRILGPLTVAQAEQRGVTAEWIDELLGARRLFPTRLGGVDVLAATEDAARLRDAAGAPLPQGLPAALLEPVAAPVTDLVARFARTHGPFTEEQAAASLGLGRAVVAAELTGLAARHRVANGGFRPGATGSEWCDAEVLRRIRRLSAARLQQQIEPVPQQALARFLPQWSEVAAHGSDAPLRGPDGVYAAIERLAGVPLPASAWERFILPARVAAYQPHWLDELTSSGEVVWWGTAALPGKDGWVALAPSHLGDALRPALGLPDLPEGALVPVVLDVLQHGGAWFFPQLLSRIQQEQPSATPTVLLDALWSLVWAGRIGNDSFAPLRSYLGGPAGRSGTARRRRPGSAAVPPTAVGRWAGLSAADQTSAAAAAVERIVARHGLVVRGSLAAESLPGGFSAAYKVMSAMAERGRLTRLYLVDGLGGAQFAAPGVVDRVRDAAGERGDADPIVLAATDPANPFGAALAWPEASDSNHRPGRKAGAVVVLTDGALALYLERGGRSLLTFSDDDLGPPLAALGAVLRRIGTRASIQKLNGRAVTDPSNAQTVTAMTAAGFALTPSGLRPSRGR